MARTEGRRAGGRPSAATRQQFLSAATRRFAAGERVDVQAICSELGLSRATVHRWLGSRDRVLGEVMGGLVVPLFRRIDRSTKGSVGERLLDAFEQMARTLAGDRALTRFLEKEPEAALRILTAADGIVEPRVVDVIREAIEGEMARGFAPPADPALIAYAIVRMAESFLYVDASRGFARDFGRLRAVYATLLGLRPTDAALDTN